MIEIPTKYRTFVLDVYGDEGEAWLAQLPALVEQCAARWSLVEWGGPFGNAYNYVLPATRADGSEVVLKFNAPHGEHQNEIDALRFYDGEGVNRLLDADPEQGILLLERLRPGTTLAEVDDDEEATEIAANLLETLWQQAPAEHRFPTVADWFQGFARHRVRYDGVGPLNEAIFVQAEGIVRELLAEQRTPMLLHGDFHHYNILRAERAPWLIIDPKGVVGDPGYELGAFFYNPGNLLADHIDTKHVLQRRIDILSQVLHFERERVLGWGIAQAVLSAVWTCEGEGYGWEYTMGIAEALLELR